MKKIYIAKSKINGKGMFAGEDIRRGERIQYIKGKLVRSVTKNARDSKAIQNWIGVTTYFWMNTDGTPFRYINHSCDPNAAITGTKTAIALRNINVGEEITIDYSMSDADLHWKGIHCTCGSKNCRKEIRAIYTVPPDVFKRHMPYVSRYFQRVYLRNYIRKAKSRTENKA